MIEENVQILSIENDCLWVEGIQRSADYETESQNYYNLHGYTKTWLCYIENLMDDDDNFLCIDIEVFIEFVLKRFRKTRKNQYVYFHNLGFDGTFIMYALNKMGIDFESVINENRNIYEIKIYSKNRKRYVSFRCSYMIFMCSVSALPGSTKSVIDYMRIRDYNSIKDATKHEKYYIKQDVKTVKRNLISLMDIYGVKLNGRFKTNASISYKEIKKLSGINLAQRGYEWNVLMPKLPFAIDSYIRNGYNGGFTYLNPKWKEVDIRKLLVSYDMVSSYPTSQRNDFLPYGEPEMKSKLSQRDIDNDLLYMVRLKIYKAKIKDGLMPFISTNRMMKYILDDIYMEEIEKVVITVTSVDFQMIKEYYDIEYSVLDYCVFPMKAKGIFNEYIDKHFKIKSDCKKELETCTDEARIIELQFLIFISKLRINSAYGKFGTNPLMTSLVPSFEDEILKYTKEESCKEETIFYLPVATFITAYRRKALIDVIQLNADRFVYCDTDSVKLIGTDAPTGAILGKGLGEWDYEYTAVRSKFMKSKQYIHEILYDGIGPNELKRTVASMSRTQHKRVNFENCVVGHTFVGGKKQGKSVKGGKIIIDGPFTFT